MRFEIFIGWLASLKHLLFQMNISDSFGQVSNKRYFLIFIGITYLCSFGDNRHPYDTSEVAGFTCVEVIYLVLWFDFIV